MSSQKFWPFAKDVWFVKLKPSKYDEIIFKQAQKKKKKKIRFMNSKIKFIEKKNKFFFERKAIGNFC
jgi:hypothetical protein